MLFTVVHFTYFLGKVYSPLHRFSISFVELFSCSDDLEPGWMYTRGRAVPNVPAPPTLDETVMTARLSSISGPLDTTVHVANYYYRWVHVVAVALLCACLCARLPAFHWWARCLYIIKVAVSVCMCEPTLCQHKSLHLSLFTMLADFGRLASSAGICLWVSQLLWSLHLAGISVTD